MCVCVCVCVVFISFFFCDISIFEGYLMPKHSKGGARGVMVIVAG